MMAITSTVSTTISSPTVPYNLLAVSVNFVQSVGASATPTAIQIIAQKYRTLNDGTYEKSPTAPMILSYSDSQTDSTFAALQTAIEAAIQTFATAKGL
jgi:hypothetical protein